MLRLVRLGKQLHGDPAEETAAAATMPVDGDDNEGPGENAGLSDILDEVDEANAEKHRD